MNIDIATEAYLFTTKLSLKIPNAVLFVGFPCTAKIIYFIVIFCSPFENMTYQQLSRVFTCIITIQAAVPTIDHIFVMEFCTSSHANRTYMCHPRSEERRVGKECRSRWSP